MNDKLTKFLTVFVVIGVVAQVSVAPVAAAGDDGPGVECFARGLLEALGADQCVTPSDSAATTHSDLYAHGVSSSDYGESTTTGANNYAEAAKSYQWCLGRSTIVNGLQSGHTLSQIQSDVNSTVNERTADRQSNYIEAHNSQLTSAYYIMDSLHGNIEGVGWMDTGANNGYSGWQNDQYVYNPTYSQYQPFIRDSATVTLADGSSKNVTVAGIEEDGGTFERSTGLAEMDGEGAIILTQPGYTTDTNSALDKARSHQIYVEDKWVDGWNSIQSMADYSKTNLNKLAASMHANYTDGDFEGLSSEDLHSACSLATESTDQDSTGAFAHLRAANTIGGFDGDVNSSMTIDYTTASAQSFHGNTDVSESSGDLTVSSPNYGDGAVVTGDEVVQFDVQTDASNPDVTVDLTDKSGALITSFDAADSNGDGTYRAPLSAGNYSTVADGDSLYFATTVVGGGTTESVSVAQWNYDTNGGETIQLEGGLFTDWSPAVTNGSFDVNTTYDTVNAGSTVHVAAQFDDGRSRLVKLDGQFEIVSMTDVTTGEEINSTTLEDNQVDTTETSFTKEQVQSLLDWRAQHNENYDGGGTFSLDASGLNINGALIGGGVAIVVLILVLREI